MKKIKFCRVCGSSTIKTFFDLGRQPLANSLLPTSVDENENFYPLSLSWCADCNLIQLNHTIDPKILFSHYVWVTGTSKAANEFSEKFYKELVARAGRKKDGYILEVASNDGTFLRPFMRNNYRVLGVDPAKNITDMAEISGVPTKCVFFGTEAAKEIKKEMGLAKMVFARNVLAHVADAHDFVEGLSISLADNGVLAIEVHYAKIILESLHYDSIYHEHLCYFSLKSLERLLNKHGLYVFDLVENLISGGCLIVYAKKKKVKSSLVLFQYRKNELKSRTNELASWKNFAKRSIEHREHLLQMLTVANKESEGGLVGWGASARSSTLLNFCGIDSKILPVIIDLNPLKQGRYTAGTHIPIKGAEDVISQNPKVVFILAWNFKNEIIDILKNKYKFKGKCIIPLPNEPIIS